MGRKTVYTFKIQQLILKMTSVFALFVAAMSNVSQLRSLSQSTDWFRPVFSVRVELSLHRLIMGPIGIEK